MANETTVLNVTENLKLKERSFKWEYLPDSEDEAVRLLKIKRLLCTAPTRGWMMGGGSGFWTSVWGRSHCP